MTIIAALAVLFIAFEAYNLVRIRSMVEYKLEYRRIYSGPYGEERRIAMDAVALVKYVGAISIIVSKLYKAFCLVLCATKYWYIGLLIYGITFLNAMLSAKAPKHWLIAINAVDALICMGALALVAWNR